jgi:predicted transcriptional regulator
MSKPIKDPEVRVMTSTLDEFFARGREVARRLDAGEPLERTITISFSDPRDLLAVLSPARYSLLKLVKKSSTCTLNKLASDLHRQRTAVERDVKMLEKVGLVRTHIAVNKGHGRQKVVEPVAARYHLAADF